MAKDRIDRDELASKLVDRATSAEDPLRAMAEMIADFVMEAEVTEKIGAEPHERSAERTTHRNGHRPRRWDTRLGTLTLQVPKLREGGYVPSFIEHRRRSEQALISVIQEAVVKGVSTRKIEAVLEELGIAGVSAGQVSHLCSALDDKVRQFRERPLGEVRYVWVSTLVSGLCCSIGSIGGWHILVHSGGRPRGPQALASFREPVAKPAIASLPSANAL